MQFFINHLILTLESKIKILNLIKLSLWEKCIVLYTRNFILIMKKVALCLRNAKKN